MNNVQSQVSEKEYADIIEKIECLEKKEKLFVPYDIVECSDSGEENVNAKTIYEYMNRRIKSLLNCNLDQLRDAKLVSLICNSFYKKESLHWMESDLPIFSVLVSMYICDTMRRAFDKAHEPIIADEYAKLHDKLDEESRALLDRCYRKSEEKTRSILDQMNYLDYIYKLEPVTITSSPIPSSSHDCPNSIEFIDGHVELKPQMVSCVNIKGNLELMEIASAARAKSFIAHPACQRAIESRWQPEFKISQFYFVLYFWSCGFAHFLIPSSRSPLRRRFFCELGCAKSTHKHINEGKRRSRDTQDGIRVQTPVSSNSIEMQPLTGQQETTRIRKKEDGSVRIIVKKFFQKFDLCRKFYTSPNSKYFVHMFLRFIYVIFYAFVLVRLKRTESPHLDDFKYEFMLFVWQSSYVADMFAQMFDMSPHRYIQKNRVDLYRNFIIIFNIIFVLCGLAVPKSRIFVLPLAHFAFYLSFIFAVVRSLKLFSTDAFFGSIVLMIKKMTSIMLKFLTVFLVFGFAYTVCYVSLKGSYASSNSTIGWLLFSAGAFEIFGEATEGDRAGEITECPAIFNWDEITDMSAHCLFRTWILPVLLFSYMLLSGIMLVNLVTAILNKEYDIISQQSHIYWKYKLYDRLREYETKIWIPAPLSSLYYVFIRFPFEIILRILHKCDKTDENVLSQFLITTLYNCGDVDTSWTPETSRRELSKQEINELRSFVKKEVNQENLLRLNYKLIRHRSSSIESSRIRSYSTRFN